MTHSQTPWRALSAQPDIINIDNGNYYICTLSNKGDGYNPDQAANADFIVRACNNYQMLVDGIEEVLSSGDLSETSLAGMFLSDILEKAKGEQP